MLQILCEMRQATEGQREHRKSAQQTQVKGDLEGKHRAQGNPESGRKDPLHSGSRLRAHHPSFTSYLFRREEALWSPGKAPWPWGGGRSHGLAMALSPPAAVGMEIRKH